MDIFSVITLIGGLAFFLFGMHVMSADLEKMAGGKLEHLLRKMTANPFVSLVLGAVITIAMQSSCATTVMLGGLVYSGIMEFNQTINVIFGANIGTTLTAWILSLSGIQSENVLVQMLKPANFSPILALIGMIMLMVSKSDKKKSIGSVFVGFAILMYGMTMMADAVSPLSETPQFSELLVRFNNPILGVLIGTVFTGIIQSSAASVGILQALSMTGSITFGMAIPIVMGQNIGTCVTSLLSSIGVSKNAKRVVVVHFSIKVIGTIICLSVFEGLNAIFHFAFVNTAVSPVTIAMVHTIFNVLITMMLMPFDKLLVRLSELVVPDKDRQEKQIEPFLDERLLSTPSVAIAECEHKTVIMADMAKQTIFDAIALFGNYSEKDAEQINESEEVIDLYEDKLGSYLVQLSGKALSTGDTNKISKMLHSIGDFERLGDHALNLCDSAKEVHEKKLRFSNEAMQELDTLTLALSEILTNTMRAFETGDLELASRVEPLEQVIDSLIETVKVNHVKRLQDGRCTIELGFILSDLLTNYERISDHCSNIAVCVIETSHSSFDTHEYLSKVKSADSTFAAEFQEYLKKYTLPEQPKPAET